MNPPLVRLALAAVLVAGCATAEWQSRLDQDHPLVGRVWDVAAARFIDPEAAEAALGARLYVLLGEKHDNPDHHALQARLVRALAASGRRPTIAFEMLGTDHAGAIATQLARAPTSADGLADAVDWKRSGWEWSLYRPLVQTALDAGLPVVAANIPVTTARALARGDASTLDPALAATYGLDRPPSQDVLAAMTNELREAHCGHLPERLVGGMVTAQRARDAQMAAAMLGAGPDGAVLIAGTGHVRRDRGVPAYLRARRPDASTASVAFVEVRRELTTPAAYAAAWDGSLPFDYLWFTPRLDDKDPCEAFRARGPS